MGINTPSQTHRGIRRDQSGRVWFKDVVGTDHGVMSAGAGAAWVPVSFVSWVLMLASVLAKAAIVS
jgi:hypothetical protein